MLRALAMVAVLLGWSAMARAAELVVYHAPPEAGVAIAVRDAVARTAAAAGAAFLDLSPQPEPAPAAAALLARGVEHFEAMRLDDAAAALDDALAEVRATGAAGLAPAQLSDLFLHRALVATQRGDGARAWEELIRAAAVDATRRLDPARFPPKVVAAFQRAVAAVAGGDHGELAVETRVACRVLVDGRPAEVPPRVPYGEHFVRRECAGERATGAVVVLAQPARTVSLPRAPAAAPDDAGLLALSRERDAGRLLVVAVRASAEAPATLTLRLLDGRSGALLDDATVAAGDAEGARAACERLLVPPAPAPIAPAPPRPSPWYRRPWVWGVAGAALAAAVLLPFVVADRGAATTFSVAPTGVSW